MFFLNWYGIKLYCCYSFCCQHVYQCNISACKQHPCCMWSSYLNPSWFNCHVGGCHSILSVFFHKLNMPYHCVMEDWGLLRWHKQTLEILGLWGVWQWWKLLVKKTICMHFTANRAPSSPHGGQGGAGFDDQGGAGFDDQGGAGRSAGMGRVGGSGSQRQSRKLQQGQRQSLRLPQRYR